jgi:hypothetical protein
MVVREEQLHLVVHGKGQFGVRCVGRRDDRVPEALQEAREYSKHQRVVINQENLQWAHLSHKAPLAGRKAVRVQTPSLKHPDSDGDVPTVTESVRF